MKSCMHTSLTTIKLLIVQIFFVKLPNTWVLPENAVDFMRAESMQCEKPYSATDSKFYFGI